jgi:hypothetical protein
MKRIGLPVALLAMCLSLAAEKKKDDTASFAELAAITARGRSIAEYDIAAWHATDAIQDLKPEQGSTRYYIAKKGESGWAVAFGRLNEAHDKFLTVYEATQGARPEFFSARKYAPPRESGGFYLFAAKAFEAALKDLGPVNRPYNAYAITSESGQLYVYLLPASDKDGAASICLAEMYATPFSADGGTLLEKRQMHKTILEFNSKDKSSGIKKLEAGYHTHVLSNIPEDSDVFYVLSRKPLIPEYIGTQDKKIYVVQTDGTIILGK